MDAETIKTKLHSMPLTARSAIAEWRVRTGLDSTGDPAVWIYVVVRDDLLEAFEATWEDAERQIVATVAAIAPEAFAYVGVQLESEVAPGVVAYW